MTRAPGPASRSHSFGDARLAAPGLAFDEEDAFRVPFRLSNQVKNASSSRLRPVKSGSSRTSSTGPRCPEEGAQGRRDLLGALISISGDFARSSVMISRKFPEARGGFGKRVAVMVGISARCFEP